MPHAAITARWPNSKPAPVSNGLKVACNASEKCLTGKIPANVLSQFGASSVRMKTSETKNSGKIVPLTIAGAAWANEQAIELEGLTVSRTSLEDVYLKLTKEAEAKADEA